MTIKKQDNEPKIEYKAQEKDRTKKHATKKHEVDNKQDVNIIRTVSTNIVDKMNSWGIANKTIGLFYIYIHYVLGFLVGFAMLFNNNINYLCILLVIVSLDAFSIVVLHGCPLSHLEQKYLNYNTCQDRSNYFKKSGIMYTCDHEYEKQIELLVNVWTVIAIKCLLILFFKTFHIQLKNYNDIYI
jgi:hypothetical protein